MDSWRSFHILKCCPWNPSAIRVFHCTNFVTQNICQSNWSTKTFNFWTLVTLLHPFSRAGIITSLWNEVKSWAARLGVGWKTSLSSLDQTVGEARGPMCLKENSRFHHSNLSSLSLPQVMTPSSCSSQKSKSHPNFTLSINPGPSFQFTTVGPVDSTYEMYLKATHFSPSVLLPPLSKPSWFLALTPAMAS